MISKSPDSFRALKPGFTSETRSVCVGLSCLILLVEPMQSFVVLFSKFKASFLFSIEGTLLDNDSGHGWRN